MTEAERIITIQRHLKISDRVCVVCSKTFQGWGVQKYCSKQCARRADYHKHPERRRATRRAYYRRVKGEVAGAPAHAGQHC